MSINVHYSFDLIIVPGIATAETFNFFSIWNSKFYMRKKKTRRGRDGKKQLRGAVRL